MAENSTTAESENLSVEQSDQKADKRRRSEGVRRNYTLKEKIDIVSQYKANEPGFGFHTLSKKYNLPRSTLQGWVKQKDHLTACLKNQQIAVKNRRRVPGGGRKPLFAELEQDVVRYMCDQSKRGVRVTEKDLHVS